MATTDMTDKITPYTPQQIADQITANFPDARVSVRDGRLYTHNATAIRCINHAIENLNQEAEIATKTATTGAKEATWAKVGRRSEWGARVDGPVAVGDRLLMVRNNGELSDAWVTEIAEERNGKMLCFITKQAPAGEVE